MNCCSFSTLEDDFPSSLTVPLCLKCSLRYGENPHQMAAFYVDKSLSEVNGGGIATAIQHHGMDSDDLTPEDIEFNLVSEKTPQENELSDAKFAWLCVKHVKNNAIVIAKENCMLGMGSGQPNRLESLRIALRKAGDEVKGAALASDAFFPFAEPGGSIRDGDAVDCCNKYGVSLLFTNVRHFRH
ncbi:hypothetical protein RHMOL_Rhmol04G0162400 [Rhododendron molle]|uniref:Uncharacterized protein n=1 Tax=Rhododendron molle TaxID=49168 RepID=A0ACC0P3K4_RHOML|nr:hypothetical protein RHMOL_Rhmol04G0162400 [Rhododendron molle]